MRKNTKHVPPALKHGIYSGFDLLPTELTLADSKIGKAGRPRALITPHYVLTLLCTESH
jgi:hypothetical protein